MSEPDWTETDPSEAEVKAWMKAQDIKDALELANKANQHFARPFHITLLRNWAAEILRKTP